MSMTEPREEQDAARIFSVLIGLCRRARHAGSVEELIFVMVNETMALAPYRQAILWSPDDGIAAVSAVATVERNAPFALWLDRLLNRFGKDLTEPRKLDASDAENADAEQWQEWLPAHLLLVPLTIPDGKVIGLLAFAREAPWSEAETLFIAEVAETYALVWAWRRQPGLAGLWRARIARIPRFRLMVAVALLGIAVIPVRLSVLASGEVVARDPAVIRSPIEGVVEKVFVTPNQPIGNGEPLFELNTTATRGKLDVARKALSTAKAEHEQAAQQAFFDNKAKAQLGILSSRIEERQAELAYLDEVLERSRVKAPRGGIAILDDPAEWIGRPVGVGERVLAIADERDTEIEAWLAPADAIPLAEGAPLTLFLNVDPLHAVHGSLRYVTYESLQRPDGTLAHRLRAAVIAGEEKPRLGLKGTARLDGERVPLAYWLLRRPWTVVRQTLGF